MDQTLETIAAMCRQEEGYDVPMTLSQLEQNYQSSAKTTTKTTTRTTTQPFVTGACRTSMTAWCYSVVDYCNVRRETVEVAMNFLDRYVSSTPTTGQHFSCAFLDQSVYQLSAMTCLYMAVKIHEPSSRTMDLQMVSNLSRGVFRCQQIERMEFQILTALNWRVNPPTALSFVRQFLDFIPPFGRSANDDTAGANNNNSSKNDDEHPQQQQLRQTIYDLTKYQIELAVAEVDLVTVRASMIAVCALRNALESLFGSNKSTAAAAALTTETTLQQISGISCCCCLSIIICIGNNNDRVLEVQTALYELVLHQPSACTTGWTLQPPCSSPSKYNDNDNDSPIHFTKHASSSFSLVETSPRSSILSKLQ